MYMGIVAEKGQVSGVFSPVQWLVDWIGNVQYKGSDVSVGTIDGTLTIDTTGADVDEAVNDKNDKNGLVIIERIPAMVWIGAGILGALVLFRR